MRVTHLLLKWNHGRILILLFRCLPRYIRFVVFAYIFLSALIRVLLTNAQHLNLDICHLLVSGLCISAKHTWLRVTGYLHGFLHSHRFANTFQHAIKFGFPCILHIPELIHFIAECVIQTAARLYSRSFPVPFALRLRGYPA